MRKNPNKVIKVIKKSGEEYVIFLTGKMLAFYLLVFECSARERINRTTYELHASGQTKAVKFYCDKSELEQLLAPKEQK